jgi:hypothetical protein
MWPFRKNNEDALKKSEEAKLEAERVIVRVKARDKEVQKVSGELRKIRQENHFAENLRIIMQGRV